MENYDEHKKVISSYNVENLTNDYNKIEAKETFFKKGASYFNKGEYNKAIEFLNKALELDKNNAIIYLWLGAAYNNKSKYDKAIDILNKALELDENSVDNYYWLGAAYFNKGKCDKAIKNLEKALELKECSESDLTYRHIYFGLSKVYSEKEDTDNHNKYLSAYYDLKFHKYIEEIEYFNYELKIKIYTLFNNVINLRNKMLYKVKNNQVVGHYTKISTLKHLIKSNNDFEKPKLRLNNVAYMNDPTEGEVFFELLSKESDDFKDKDFKNFINNLYISESYNEREILNRKSSVFLTSFSESIDTSLPMWVQYSEDGQGCCLTLNSNFFDDEDKCSCVDSFNNPHNKINNIEDDNEECYCLYKIKYIEYKENTKEKKAGYYLNENKEEFREIMNSLYELKDDVDSNDELKEIIQNILDQIRFLFKDKNYEHEKELRLIKFENNGKVKYTGDNEGFIVPHVYIDMDRKLEVEEVILGPKVKNPMEIATYLYYTGNVEKVSKSKIKYK